MLAKNKDFFLKFMDPKYLIPLFLVSLVIVVFEKSKTEAVELRTPETHFSDTIIPPGYSLTPISIANAEALSALIDGFALVDVYTVDSENQKAGQKILGKAKLIRAPRDPNQYAILLPESESGYLMQKKGPFSVVIKNPNAAAKLEFTKKFVPLKNIEVL